MEIPLDTLRHLHTDSGYVDRLQQECHASIAEIDHIDQPISYQEFFEKYMLPNRACVLGSWATADWRSRRDWVTTEGRPCLDFLKSQFGKDTGPAADCKAEEYSAHPKKDMTVAEFVDYLEEYKRSDYSDEKPCLYFKDWHFQRAFPEYQAYTTPVFFQSDWLNEFWDNRNDGQLDDYRFVYIGPKDSWTPLHADVFRSYSWSANICGRKKWIMFPPGEEECLKDVHGQLAFDLRSPELRNQKKYPRYSEVRRQFEVIQEAGEVIFVPTGWHHQVFNLEDTISINHNWMNGCNSALCWTYIKTCLEDVKKEISDCQDMDGWSDQCQVILKCTAGIDFTEFFHFVHVIGCRRVQHVHKLCPGFCDRAELKQDLCTLCESKCQPCHQTSAQQISVKCDNNFKSTTPQLASCSQHCTLTDGGSTNLTHAIFDLLQVQRLLEDMTANKDFQELDQTKLVTCPPDFLQQVRAAVEFSMEYIQSSLIL